MAIRIACPNCHRQLTVPEGAVGRQGKCKACGSSFTIPPHPIADGRGAAPAAPEPKVAAKVEMQCPNCGVVVRGLPEAFAQPIACPDCKATSLFEPASPMKQPFWKKASFLVGAGTAALLLVAFVSYALFAKRTQQDSDGRAVAKAQPTGQAKTEEKEAKSKAAAKRAEAEDKKRVPEPAKAAEKKAEAKPPAGDQEQPRAAHSVASAGGPKAPAADERQRIFSLEETEATAFYGAEIEGVVDYAIIASKKADELFKCGPLPSLSIATPVSGTLASALGKSTEENKKRCKMLIGEICADDLKKTMAILGEGAETAGFAVLVSNVCVFYVGAGRKHCRTAFQEAMGNISPERAQAVGKLLGPEKQEGAGQSAFSPDGRCRARGMLQLMYVSGMYVDETGKFQRDAFNTALGGIGEDRIRQTMKAMKNPAPATAHAIVMRLAAPGRAETKAAAKKAQAGTESRDPEPAKAVAESEKTKEGDVPTTTQKEFAGTVEVITRNGSAGGVSFRYLQTILMKDEKAFWLVEDDAKGSRLREHVGKKVVVKGRLQRKDGEDMIFVDSFALVK